MKKKIFVIIFAFIFLLIHFIMGIKYMSDTNKINIIKEFNEQDVVTLDLYSFFEKLIEKDIDSVKDNIKIDKYSDISKFKDYIYTEILGDGNLMTVLEYKKVDKTKFELIIKISPPQFASKEMLNKKIYQVKNVKVIINKKSLFDYEIVEFEKC